MELRISHNLWMDSALPILHCHSFGIKQSPGEHASLQLRGWLDTGHPVDFARLADSKIKVWMEQDKGGKKVLFYGYLAKIKRVTKGGTEQVLVEGISASWLLDRQSYSRSFQQVEQTFYEIAEQIVTDAGGHLLDNLDDDRVIQFPIIQYQETIWEFCKRLASHLGTWLVPEISSGYPTLEWGIPTRKEIPAFLEHHYEAELVRMSQSGEMESIYRLSADENFEIGDYTRFLHKTMVIFEKIVQFEHGVLRFEYLLKHKQPAPNRAILYNSQFAGLGLHGWIQAAKGELVQILLEIDQRKDTGDYWYDWYPETGNALYAMPEPGAPVTVYFNCEDEQEGFVLHCIHPEATRVHQDDSYSNRELNRKEQSRIELFPGQIGFTQNSHHLSLNDGQVSVGTLKTLDISAAKKVTLKASRITITAPDEIDIYQG